MLIAGLLWIGDFSITLKPFSVSLPCWYKSVGIPKAIKKDLILELNSALRYLIEIATLKK